MHKLVILIEPLEDRTDFEESWPEFLHLVESMPGLLREATSRVELILYGNQYAQVHELYFDSLLAAQSAMASDQGRAAGRLLQQITDGKMALFIADHHQDEIENIMKYRKDDDQP